MTTMKTAQPPVLAVAPCLTWSGGCASMRHPSPGIQSMNLSREAMNAVLRPRAIAVVGASARDGAVGNRIMGHAAGARFGGHLFGVHPRHKDVRGRLCAPSLADLPEPIDCVVMAVGDGRIEAAMIEAAGRSTSMHSPMPSPACPCWPPTWAT